MKNLKNIIRKNLNLISESDKLPWDYLEVEKQKYNSNRPSVYVVEDLPNAPLEYKVATEIFFAFSGFGSNFNKFKEALEKIKTWKQFQVVDKYYNSFKKNEKHNAEYDDIISAINGEGEVDNQEDINKINEIIGPKWGKIIDGGWDKTLMNFSKWTWGNYSSKNTSNTENDDKKITSNNKNDGNKNTSGSNINNDIKDIQTMISKTQYANVLPTKRSSTGIDGYWGKRTSQALLSLLNDYENKTKNNNNYEFSNLTKKEF